MRVVKIIDQPCAKFHAEVSKWACLAVVPDPSYVPKGEAYDPQKRLRISRSEWFNISAGLEEFHAVFYKVWQMGRPHFTEDVETAAVQFDETGNFVWFHFNPKFWFIVLL